MSRQAEQVAETASPLAAPDGRRYKVAITGASHGHTNLYLPALAEDRRVRSVSLSDPDPDALRHHAAREVVSGTYADPQEMVDRSRPDVIFVLGRHSEMAKAAEFALDVGVPVVLEKPGAMTVTEVESIQALARERGVPVLVPFVQRCGPLPSMFDAVGRVQHVTLQFLAGPPARYRDYGMGWMLEAKSARAGVLLNLAVHFIDIFLWKMSATDRPVDIHGTLARFDEAIEVDDLARLTITTESGAVASIEAGYSYPSRDGRHINYVVRGTDGLVSADRHGNAELVTAERATNFTVDVDSDHYYGTWVTRLLDGLDEGFEELATIDDLVAVRRVTDLLLDDAAPSRSLSTRWRRADAVPEIH